MQKYKRGHAEFRGIVDAPIDDVWELLTDWANFERWWVKPEDGGRPGPNIASVELVGAPNEVPRTRIVRHVTGSAVDAPLWLTDDVTKRIVYDMVFRPNPNGAVLRSEFRNYLATTMLDSLPTGETLMTFKSEFDIVEEADTNLMISLIERTYSDAILNGFRKYFERQKAQTVPA